MSNMKKAELIEKLDAGEVALVAYWTPPCTHYGARHTYGGFSFEVSTGYRKAVGVGRHSACAVLNHYGITLPEGASRMIGKRGVDSVKMSILNDSEYKKVWGKK